MNTTYKSKIDFIEHPSNACEIQKHTKLTLFAVFECWVSRVRHCVCNLAKQQSFCLVRLSNKNPIKFELSILLVRKAGFPFNRYYRLQQCVSHSTMSDLQSTGGHGDMVLLYICNCQHVTLLHPIGRFLNFSD